MKLQGFQGFKVTALDQGVRNSRSVPSVSIHSLEIMGMGVYPQCPVSVSGCPTDTANLAAPIEQGIDFFGVVQPTNPNHIGKCLGGPYLSHCATSAKLSYWAWRNLYRGSWWITNSNNAFWEQIPPKITIKCCIKFDPFKNGSHLTNDTWLYCLKEFFRYSQVFLKSLTFHHGTSEHLGEPQQHPFLVGGWTNPSEKYDRQIGNHLPQIGMNLDFPEIRGFPFLSYLLGWGRVRSL